MANNYLYLGDIETLEYILIEKLETGSWNLGYFDSILLECFLLSRWETNDEKTQLRLFDISDPLHDKFLKEGKRFEVKNLDFNFISTHRKRASKFKQWKIKRQWEKRFRKNYE